MFRNSSSSSSRHGGSTWVGVFLVAALGLSAVLAWQAIEAGRSSMAVAREAAEEQALFAAWEFTNQARSLIDEKISKKGLDIVSRMGGKWGGAPLRFPERAAEWGDWADIGPTVTRTFFRYDVATGEVAVAGQPDPGLERWAPGVVQLHRALYIEDSWLPVIADPRDGGGRVAYRLYPDGSDDPEVVFGFRLLPGAFEFPLGLAFNESALLPEVLTRGTSNAKLFSVSVVDRKRAPVWSSASEYASTLVAHDTLGARFAGLTTWLAVNPDAVASLTIGGLPESRLALVVGLLLLTAGLVAAAFRQLRREAELGRLRSDFVSGVSHELRTPLAQIRMFAETLLLGRVRSDEERERSLRIIVNESERLSQQVSNVLLYSKSERDELDASLRSEDLSGLIDEVAEAFRPLAEKAKAELVVTSSPGLEALVDRELLRQALLNLLDNAAKYGPVGQTILLGLGRVPGGRILVWVEDEGPGVAPTDRERIWEPYFRSDAHRESAIGGSGIGLAVVQRIVSRMGGGVRVEESERGGGRFVIDLAENRGGSASPNARDVAAAGRAAEVGG